MRATWRPCAAPRLVAVAESERDRRWDERRLKLLTGGDPVTTGNGHYTPTFKLIVTGNQPPRLDIVDEAIRRRIRVVPFNHRPSEPDRRLEGRLREEAPGILRWMIEGLPRLERERARPLRRRRGGDGGVFRRRGPSRPVPRRMLRRLAGRSAHRLAGRRGL